MSYHGLGFVAPMVAALNSAERRRADPRTWPKASRDAFVETLRKYGRPTSTSSYGAIWARPHGPWKRTIVVRKGFLHNWPSPHMDVLLQTIDYRVLPSTFTKLARYDGSVIAERTAGELSARCGGEKMNFVAVNLAHDVFQGCRNVQQARREYERLARLVGAGKTPRYAKGLAFRAPRGYRGDPDHAVQGLGVDPLPPMTPTQLFAEAVDPYSWRFSPPGAVFSPYGWGPDFNIGMPMNYTHHLGYQRVPIPGTRRNIGPMYDELWPYRTGTLAGSWNGSASGDEASYASLSGVLAVL